MGIRPLDWRFTGGWGSDTFSDQIRFLEPNLFLDAPRNVLTGVNALTAEYIVYILLSFNFVVCVRLCVRNRV